MHAGSQIAASRTSRFRQRDPSQHIRLSPAHFRRNGERNRSRCCGLPPIAESARERWDRGGGAKPVLAPSRYGADRLPRRRIREVPGKREGEDWWWKEIALDGMEDRPKRRASLQCAGRDHAPEAFVGVASVRTGGHVEGRGQLVTAGADAEVGQGGQDPHIADQVSDAELHGKL